MATSSLSVDQGTEVKLATHTVDEDGGTKHIPRNVPTKSDGSEIAPALDATLQDVDTNIGATNETAPATDIALSGLNGRLQRIAQRITSLIALLPTALGAGGGLKVDGSGTALPISGTITATPLTGKTVPIAVSSSGDTSLVSEVSGKKIKVVSLHFVSRGTVTVKWKLGTVYMGEEDYIVNTGISASSSEGVLVTGVGEALSINLSASVYVGGSLTYVEV